MKKVLAFTGAGISAESGIPTYRGFDGLWDKTEHELVASPAGWRRDRHTVIDFWNVQRRRIASADPNAAHHALKNLERLFEVIIVTQNVDDLHERAGSSSVIHLHGELMKSRSSLDPQLVYNTGPKDIEIGDKCKRGSQLRPHVVWFGETVLRFKEAQLATREADIIIVVGTSLEVQPAASLVNEAKESARRFVVDPGADSQQPGVIAEPATVGLPRLVDQLEREVES